MGNADIVVALKWKTSKKYGRRPSATAYLVNPYGMGRLIVSPRAHKLTGDLGAALTARCINNMLGIAGSPEFKSGKLNENCQMWDIIRSMDEAGFKFEEYTIPAFSKKKTLPTAELFTFTRK